MNNTKVIESDMVANNLEAAFPTHPEILNGRRPTTEKTALLFEAALGINAEPLLQMQMQYNMRAMTKDKGFMQRLADIRRAVAVL